jgi:hypothetical protein
MENKPKVTVQDMVYAETNSWHTLAICIEVRQLVKSLQFTPWRNHYRVILGMGEGSRIEYQGESLETAVKVYNNLPPF